MDKSQFWDKLYVPAFRFVIDAVMDFWPLILLIIIIGFGIRILNRLIDHSAFDFRNRRLINKARTTQDILSADPTQFEHLCRLLFENQGYKVHVTQKMNDGGIDIVGSKDGIKMVAQCKRWSSKAVGRPEIQQLYGAMVHEGADHAYFLTTSRYTDPAKEFVSGKPITLVDKGELAIWVHRYGEGKMEELVIDDNPSPDESSGYEAICSSCGEKTTLSFKPTTGKPVYCKQCYAKRWKKK